MEVVFGASWLHYLGIIVMLYGIALFWRGLHGGRNGERGLARRGVPMLERLEGWRLTLIGLTLAGLGAAWFWDVYWLLILTVSIGFVELHETTHVLRAWRWDGGGTQKRASSPPTCG